jgi:hypothetical protein
MKMFVIAALILTTASPASAQKVGTYFLNKSLNKTIVFQGSSAYTVPAPVGSGTTYHAENRNAVCDGWAYIGRENRERVPAHVRHRCGMGAGR